MNWFKDRFNLMTPPSHREPLGQLDVWGGRTEPPTEDFAGEPRAEVTTPKRGPVTATFCPLTDDMTAGLDGLGGRSIELLEPAPTDPPGGAVTDHAPAPSGDTAPDHGPLAAALSDRTRIKVLSRPAHVPSLVLLDRDAAAQHLADEVESLLTVLVDTHPHAFEVRVALADYRETIR